MRRFLPSPPARILDVGGGPGAHARWLVADGYQVELIDPVVRHVDQAAVCPATIGDARRLTAADASYDVVELSGPLYHLPAPDDRKKALAEGRRVVRPGGLVAAAATNRYSSVFEHVTYTHLHKERIEASISTILSTAVHDGKRGFTLAYFHRAPGDRKHGREHVVRRPCLRCCSTALSKDHAGHQRALGRAPGLRPTPVDLCRLSKPSHAIAHLPGKRLPVPHRSVDQTL